MQIAKNRKRRLMPFPLAQLLKVMKLTAVFLIVLSLQVSANGYSQKVTLNLRNAPVEKLIKEIRKQTGYLFLYKSEQLRSAGNISVQVEDAELERVLTQSLSGTSLTFKIVEKTIIILPRPVVISENNMQPQQQEADIQVSGRVTSSGNDQPLSGASVKLKGSEKGTSTDSNGNFTLQVPDGGGVLVISYVGYETIQLPVSKAGHLKIELKQKEAKIEEVIVIGYGTQKKSDITGSISSIKAAAVSDLPVVSFEELLKGQAAGVQSSVSSGAPGSAVNINIRGISSISAGTQPLYVIDGLPVVGEYTTTNFSENRTVMDFINPSDIESIEILKDASATAIYGARAANGVILITTKTGKEGKSKISFSASAGISTMANKIDMMTTRQNQEYWETAKVRDNKVSDPLSADLLDINTDWQKVSSRNALRQQYNINYQGGQQKSNYYLSFDYLNQQGLFKYTNHRRFQILANVGSQINKKLYIENHLNLMQSDNEGTFTGGEGTNPNTSDAIKRIFNAPTYRLPTDKAIEIDSSTGETYINPLVVLKDLNDDIRNISIQEQLKLKYQIIPGLEFQSMTGLSYRFLTNEEYQGADYVSTKNDERIRASLNNSNRRSIINENTITYKRKIKNQDLTFLLGNTLQVQTTSGNQLEGIGFANTATGVNALQNADESNISSFREEWQLQSFFGRLNYNLAKKYLLTATLRADGSSKLAKGNKWGTFPSVAFAWNASEENFLSKISWLNNLKVRMSWGQIGNSEIGVYQTLSVINSGTVPFDNQLLPYYRLDRYGDPNLKWEISEQSNVGFDLGLLNQRLSITADIYVKKTKDLLLDQPTPLSSGYTSYLTNVGSMNNKGFEISINRQHIQTRKITWSTNVNFSANKNEVTAIGNVDKVSFGQTVDGKNAKYLVPGKSIGSFFLVKTNGVWQLGEEVQAAAYQAKPGDWKYVDQNKDGVIDNEDRIFIGDALPAFTWGVSNTVKYKNLDLLFLFTGDHGGQTLNMVKPNLWRATKNVGAAYNLNAWSPTNPTNEQAAPSTNYNSDFLHDGYLEDADIIRLQNIKIGYRFKNKSRALPGMYVYFSGNNVLSWTKYDGFDPEVGNGINQGIDRYSYPKSRTYNVGFQMTF